MLIFIDLFEIQTPPPQHNAQKHNRVVYIQKMRVTGQVDFDIPNKLNGIKSKHNVLPP